MATEPRELQILTNMLAFGIVISHTQPGVDRCSRSLVEQAFEKLGWTENDPYDSVWNITPILAEIITTTYNTNDTTVVNIYDDRMAQLGALISEMQNETPGDSTRHQNARLHSILAFELEQLKLEGIASSRTTAQVLHAVSDVMESQPPFVCCDTLIGVVARIIQSGDVLVRFDMDPDVLFILWPVGETCLSLWLELMYPR